MGLFIVLGPFFEKVRIFWRFRSVVLFAFTLLTHSTLSLAHLPYATCMYSLVQFSLSKVVAIPSMHGAE
jgi:hypothetical protein